MAKSKIHIKESKKGTLRKVMHAKEGEKLSVSEMKSKMKNASPAMRKKLNFAINARGWSHKADGGYIDSMNYAYGSYFDDRNKNMQTSQTVANTVGQAIPIAGVFKGIGEGAANIIAPKDEYGVSDSSGFAQGVAGFLNPLESTTSVYDDIKKGEFDSKTAMQLLLPGVGSVMQNKENKTARNNMLLQEKMKGVNASRLGQYNNENPQALPTYGLGGDVNELNQRNDLGYKYYAWGGTPSWSPNERPMHNSMYALGGDINKLSDMKGYGYNLMANGGMVESPAWYKSNALTMKTGGHLPEGNSTLKEAKEFLKLYPEEMEMGTEVEYEHTGNTKLAQRIAADHIKDSLKMNQGNPPDYYKRLQEAGISDELNKMPQMQMAKGGFLKPEKAKEMLKDGKIHGKPITDRQRKYFNAIANGWVPNKMGGGPMDFPNGGFIGAGIGMNELKKDPIVKNMEKTSNRYDEVMSKYGNLSHSITGDMVPITNKSSFIIKDIENGKPGIRNSGKVNKEVLAAISRAAAKKKVPLMTALETGMRETGLGSHNDSVNKIGAYHPSDIMQNGTDVGLPDSFDQYLLKNNLVDKKDVKKNNYGMQVSNPYKYNQHIDSYDKYLSSYKNPYAGGSPFEREMDVLSKQSGQAYNPGEANRVEKLKRERQVIMNNPQLYNYADSVYNSNMALGGIVNKLPSTGGIQDKTSSGSMKDDINNNDRVFTEYKGGGTHEQNSYGGIPIGGKAKVEENEVRVNFPDGDYIFSDRY
jgi:hypothetical protein